jgi:hypothetical protein
LKRTFNFQKYKYLKYTGIISLCGIGFYQSLKIKDENYRMGIAGLLGQMTADFIFHPIDLVNVRTKFFFQERLSTLTIAKRIMKTTGILGFFRGGSVTLLGSSLNGFIYFSLYKKIKEGIKALLEKDKGFYFVAYTLASVISEFCVYVVYYPFELVKTRIQSAQYHYKNFFDALQQIWDKNDRKASIKRLYSGFIPSLTLCLSTAFLVFFSFELSRDYFAHKRNIPSCEITGLDYFYCSFISGVVSASMLNFLEVYVIQKMIHGEKVTLREFCKPKNLYAMKSGIFIRNIYGIFYTIVLLELVKIFGTLYDVKL